MSMKWARDFAAISLLSQVPLCAWNAGSEFKNQSRVETSALVEHFPFSQSQEWFTEESYLLWKPYMENMQYGNKDHFKQIDSNHFLDKFKIKEPEFEWSSGVRVTLGRYLPRHDLWDIGLTAVYYYTDTSDKARANTADNVGFNSSFLPNGGITADRGNFAWRLNYWTFDLFVGRLFNMTSNIVFHPYFGLRGSLQYQHATSKLFVFDNLDSTTTQTINIKTILGNDFWGVGPRVGASFIYYFENHFSFLANMAASLLVGGQNLKENAFRRTEREEDGVMSERDLDFKSKDSLSVIRSNLEASLGIGWERWLKNNTVRIAPSINFEGSLWFAMNQLYDWNSATSLSANIERRRHGNLGLMGVSFNLQVDF
jgi:hypothetical protein